MGATNKPCRTCGGTGWQWLNRSWFKTDGLRRARCGICAGTGVSSYPGDPDFVKSQAARRATSPGAQS
jgi:DnaJ-class molecular chaperone